jgi:hypothetical protein
METGDDPNRGLESTMGIGDFFTGAGAATGVSRWSASVTDSLTETSTETPAGVRPRMQVRDKP